MAIVASGTMIWTAGLGGQVRHTEAQGWTTVAPAAEDAQPSAPANGEHKTRETR